VLDPNSGVSRICSIPVVPAPAIHVVVPGDPVNTVLALAHRALPAVTAHETRATTTKERARLDVMPSPRPRVASRPGVVTGHPDPLEPAFRAGFVEKA
jgi:hypothetical protein